MRCSSATENNPSTSSWTSNSRHIFPLWHPCTPIHGLILGQMTTCLMMTSLTQALILISLHQLLSQRRPASQRRVATRIRTWRQGMFLAVYVLCDHTYYFTR